MPSHKKRVSLQERRRRRALLAYGLGFVAAVSLLVATVFASRMPEVNIASVSVSEGAYVRSDLLQKLALDMLGGHYFFVIPRSNTFIYPKTSITQDALTLFPALKDITVRRNGFTALSITFTERTPDAEWCRGVGSTSECFLMDADGFVFTRSHLPNETLRTYSGAISGEPIGTTFLNSGYPALERFVSDIERATNRSARSVSVDANSDVFVVFADGGELRFARSRLGNALLESINSVFASPRFHSEERLEYADFRFGNKIYMKFEGEGME